MRLRTSILVLLLAVFAIGDATAQWVRGQVVDSLAATPVGRGFVVLVNSNGEEVARTLTGVDGVFELRAPRVGRYTLRSEVIAYRAMESHAFDVSMQTPTEITLRILRVPIRLASFEVIGEERCVPPSESMDVAPVWEEARKALSAAAWTATSRESHHLLHRYQRVESRREGLRRERMWLLDGQATQPFASIDPDRLVSRGYIVRRGDRNRYYGPDANVLLHEGFQNSHCFWAERGKRDFEGLLGLYFRPVRGRGVADIEGTLWLEPETAELRQIEYRYTDLPFDFEDDDIGGSIQFARLASGAWILSKWEIRMPLVENEQRRNRRGAIETRQVMVGLVRIGGAVIEAKAPDGHQEFLSPDAIDVSGLAYDSSRSAPLADHEVSVVGTGYSVRTDERGRFRFRALLDGDYEVTTARMDSLGFDAGRARFKFEPGTDAELVLVVPPVETVYRYHCGSGGLSVGSYVVFGTVQEAVSGLPIRRVPVELSWIDPFTPGQSEESIRIAMELTGVSRDEALRTRQGNEALRARSDDDGRYVLCPVPTRKPVMVVTDADDYGGPIVLVEFDGDRAVVDDGTGPREVVVSNRILRLDLHLTPENR